MFDLFPYYLIWYENQNSNVKKKIYKVLIGTNNKGKLKEISNLLQKMSENFQRDTSN